MDFAQRHDLVWTHKTWGFALSLSLSFIPDALVHDKAQQDEEPCHTDRGLPHVGV